MFLTFLNSFYASSLEDDVCTFPSASIACKVWNYTNMDLDCVPPLQHKASLESLNMSHNKLTTLTEHAFMGFTGLYALDLSSSSISSLPDNVFSELHSLQMLNLSSNGIWSVANSVFSGLSKLKTLDL